MPTLPNVNAAKRRTHLAWLKEITSIPTAAGREDRVVAWIENWVKKRPGLRLSRDKAGNLLIRSTRKSSRRKPIFITAHLDHPAFVVASVDENEVELEFRGGVNDPYFENAQVEIVDGSGTAHRARVVRLDSSAKPFKRVRARLAKRRLSFTIAPGDIGRWRLPRPVIRGGLLYTHACDDLAAVAAALATLDVMSGTKGFEHVGLLFTRAEEIGFIGAIAACKLKTVEKSARLICLENSRSFAESPIGAGPVLRVGDKMSVFGPALTNAIGAIMMDHGKENPQFKWQRKLMPGGTCEATTFTTYGYTSTCLCLPLGNYHNMRDIDAVNAGKRPARVGAEFISVSDFHGLVEMLIVTCAKLDDAKTAGLRDWMDRLYEERGFVLTGA
jgi:endoglucanase